MNSTHTQAQVFSPGEFIREELEARNWSQADLAGVIDRPLQSVNQIINGHKSITAQTAIELAGAFGTSALLWLSLEMQYRLSKLPAPDPAIIQRAKKMG